MSFFLLLLLGLFIYFVLQPILRVWLALRRAKRQANQYFGSQRQRRSEEPRRQNTWPQPRRKKIDPNVGEYVEFEEIRTYSATTQDPDMSTVKYEVEDQIVDVEWEDLK